MTVDVDALQTLLTAMGALVLIVSPRVKLGIDIVRNAVDLPRWGPAAISFVLSYAICIALLYVMYANKGQAFPIIMAVIFSFLASLASTADALGLTAAQNHANDTVGARHQAKRKKALAKS